MTLTTWPPVFHVRLSKRVKGTHFRFTHEKGLELVTSRKISPSKIQLLLDTHRTWIERIFNRYEYSPSQCNELPTSIIFPAFSLQWNIEYIESNSGPDYLKEDGFNLAIYTMENESSFNNKIFITWLNKKAKQLLEPMLIELSKKMDLLVGKVTFRNTKSIWGSCDKNKKIMLSSRILFLPKELIQYIMIHELSHLVHLNHSPRFWHLVAQFDPSFKAHRIALRRSQQYLPYWLYY